MYTIDVDPEKPLKVSYEGVMSGTKEEYNLDTGQFELSSPMLWKEREEFPFFFVIKDKLKNFKYHLFANIEGEISKICIYRLTENIKEYECTI